MIIGCPSFVRLSSGVCQQFTLDNISSLTNGWNFTKLIRNDPSTVLFQSCSKISCPCWILVAMATKRTNLKKKYWVVLKIVWHKWSLGDPLPRLFKSYWSLPVGGTSFYYHLAKNYWADLKIILHKWSLDDHVSNKIVLMVLIPWKTWTPGDGPVFLMYKNGKNIKKIFLSETAGSIWKLYGTNSPLMSLYHDCSNHIDPLKNMAPWDQGQFYLCIYIGKAFKKLMGGFKNLV